MFLDGTWNDREDPSVLSNVAYLHKMSLADDVKQIKYYGKGVGTNGGYDMKLGGLHGVGLSKNIKKAYAYLVENYEVGDKVYLFGFSRGAYTARSLAGLLNQCGVIDKESNASSRINKVYKSYRRRDTEKSAAYKKLNKKCPIHMIGVWDTVGALGIPVSFLKKAGDKVFAFHDTSLNDEVHFACHAVAIDEKRESFEPTLWKVTPENRDRIKQVWFPGVHSDVGGGYKDRHYSDIALRWMLEQAKGRGFLVRDDYSHDFQLDLTKAPHDSSYKLFGIEIAEKNRVAVVDPACAPRVHKSVLDRISCSGYEPIAIWDNVVNYDTLEPYEIVD